MFFGTCEHTLDEKGRALIPIRYRETLGSERLCLARDTDDPLLVCLDAQQELRAAVARPDSACSAISKREQHVSKNGSRAAQMRNRFTLLAMMILALTSFILSWVTGQAKTVAQRPDSQTLDPFVLYLDAGNTLTADENRTTASASNQRWPELRKVELLNGRGAPQASSNKLISRNETYSNVYSIAAYGQSHLPTGQRSLTTEYQPPTSAHWSPVGAPDFGGGTSLRVGTPTPTPTRRYRDVRDATRGADSNTYSHTHADRHAHAYADRYTNARLANVGGWPGRDLVYIYDAKLHFVVMTDPERLLGFYAYPATPNHSVGTNPRVDTARYGLDGDHVVIGDPLGYVTQYTYNALDRLVEEIDTLGDKTSFVYDAVGNPRSRTDANDYIDSYTYDRLYRLLTSADAKGCVTGRSCDPDSKVVAPANGNSHTPRFTCDASDHLGRIANTKDLTTDYRYDDAGNLMNITDPRTHTTQFIQDSLDRLAREINSLGNAWQYTYDPVGNRKTRLDANNALASYCYVDVHPAVRRAYGPNRNLVGMADSFGTSSWAFNELDRLIGMTDALGWTQIYTYDPVGNHTGITYPDNRTMAYSYYRINWLQPAADLLASFTNYRRADRDQVTLAAISNETVAGMTYDKTNQKQTGEPQITAYDLNGNRISMARPGPQTQSVEYRYDLKDLLTQAKETRLLHFYARDYNPQSGVWMLPTSPRERLPESTRLHRHARGSPVSAASSAREYESAETSGWPVVHNLSGPQFVFLKQEDAIEDQPHSVIKNEPTLCASLLAGIPESQIVVLTKRLLTAKVLLRNCDIRLLRDYDTGGIRDQFSAALMS